MADAAPIKKPKASEFGFRVFMKAGPLRNGAERGHGSIFHAVEAHRDRADADAADGRSALCGDRPKIMWSSWAPDGQAITCPRCLRKLAALQTEARS